MYPLFSMALPSTRYQFIGHACGNRKGRVGV
jgi:hypothetical protein